jgi:hypothetical protein
MAGCVRRPRAVLNATHTSAPLKAWRIVTDAR